MENKYKQFKPFDKVLMRRSKGDVWEPQLYGYWDEKNQSHVSVSYLFVRDGNILSYEGNEHLVGTTDEPDEEVRLEEGEWIMCASGRYSDASSWILLQFSSAREGVFIAVNGGYWSYAIRFSDFNPNDMEETKKHILCVKNGKVVKFKE